MFTKSIHVRSCFQLPPASEEADWQQGASFYHEEEERTRGLSAGCHFHSLFPGCQVDKLAILKDTCFIRFDFSKVACHIFFHLQAVCHFLERNLSPHLTAFLDLGQVLLNIFFICALSCWDVNFCQFKPKPKCLYNTI